MSRPAVTRTIPSGGTPVEQTVRHDRSDAGVSSATNKKSVSGVGIDQIVVLTQEAYDALESVDQMTLYIIR